MRPFVFRISLFFLPFVILYLITLIFYGKTPEGDLSRVGFISVKKSYRTQFADEINQPIVFRNLADINVKQENEFTVLTIGDSFSRQDNYGYQNYLAQHDSISVLNIISRNYGYNNPIALLYEICNGDIFQELDVEYVILQSAERFFIERLEFLDTTNAITLADLEAIYENREEYKQEEVATRGFPPVKLIKFPLFKILYQFDDNAFFSNVYRVKTEQPFFTATRKNELLFLYEDLQNAETNNNKAMVKELNVVLNDLSERLSEKGIELIVLPGPDKYDVYYDHIVNKEDYIEPKFFDHWNKLDKNYGFINSKKVFTDVIEEKRDIYFYDDTHWSSHGSQIIASELTDYILAVDAID